MSSENVEVKALNQFRRFADAEKQRVIERRRAEAEQVRAAQLRELARFAETFKLTTPVPEDIVGLFSNDPRKQQETNQRAKGESPRAQFRPPSLEEHIRNAPSHGGRGGRNFDPANALSINGLEPGGVRISSEEIRVPAPSPSGTLFRNEEQRVGRLPEFQPTSKAFAQPATKSWADVVKSNPTQLPPTSATGLRYPTTPPRNVPPLERLDDGGAKTASHGRSLGTYLSRKPTTRGSSENSKLFSLGSSVSKEYQSTLRTSIDSSNIANKSLGMILETEENLGDHSRQGESYVHQQYQDGFDNMTKQTNLSHINLSKEQMETIAQRFANALIDELPDRNSLLQETKLPNPTFKQSLQDYIRDYAIEIRRDATTSNTADAANTVRAMKRTIYELFIDALRNKTPISLMNDIDKMELLEKPYRESVEGWLGVSASGLQSSDQWTRTRPASEPDVMAFSERTESSIADSGHDMFRLSGTNENVSKLVEREILEHQAFKDLISKVHKLIEREFYDARKMINMRVLHGLGGGKSLTSPHRGTKAAIFHTGDWDLVSYMQEHYDNGIEQDLGATTVLTGNADNAYLCSIQTYIKHFWRKWPRVLIDAFNRALRGRGTSTEEGQKLSIVIDLDDRTVRVEGSHVFILNMAQQLAWLVAGCRVSPGGLWQSRVNITCEEILDWGQYATFAITHDISQVDPAAWCGCWNPLVGDSVVVRGFPIPLRTSKQKGLELTFELMAAIGDVPIAVQYAGGYVLKGRSVLFYPVSRESDWVQWHVVLNPVGRISYQDIDRMHGLQRLTSETLDQQGITSTRIFLGWTPYAASSLATKSYQYSRVTYSKTGPPSGTQMNMKGGSVGFSYFAIATVNVELRKRSSPYYNPSDQEYYDNLLDMAQELHVILYDAEPVGGRAWMTDGEHIILHLILHRAKQPKKHHYDEGTIEMLLPAYAGHADSVRKAMLHNMNVILKSDKSTIDGAIKPLYFRRVVHELYKTLEGLQAFNQAYASPEGVQVSKTWKHSIRGFEYMRLLYGKRRSQCKERFLEKTSGHWAVLAKDLGAIVLCGSGLGEVIESFALSPTCSSCKTAPRGRDYLVAQIKHLEDLFEESGAKDDHAKLTPSGIRWHEASRPFQQCPAPNSSSESCSCQRVQELWPGNAVGLVVVPGKLPPDGAVIFGQVSPAPAATAKDLLSASSWFSSSNRARDSLQVVERKGMRIVSTSGPNVVGAFDTEAEAERHAHASYPPKASPTNITEPPKQCHRPHYESLHYHDAGQSGMCPGPANDFQGTETRPPENAFVIKSLKSDLSPSNTPAKTTISEKAWGKSPPTTSHHKIQAPHEATYAPQSEDCVRGGSKGRRAHREVAGPAPSALAKTPNHGPAAVQPRATPMVIRTRNGGRGNISSPSNRTVGSESTAHPSTPYTEKKPTLRRTSRLPADFHRAPNGSTDRS
ncbi:hypothetical protein LTR84_001884 [Exophiala bonariae]|uniref:Uncharacterized protein n=1 Tax=Exophiala bonariae TaxID=1690606 RepID=A0AAV9NFC0_9EURO|nr:hypothetical protein LTR84_001884 [Exophiala bonariae]